MMSLTIVFKIRYISYFLDITFDFCKNRRYWANAFMIRYISYFLDITFDFCKNRLYYIINPGLQRNITI